MKFQNFLSHAKSPYIQTSVTVSLTKICFFSRTALEASITGGERKTELGVGILGVGSGHSPNDLVLFLSVVRWADR